MYEFQTLFLLVFGLDLVLVLVLGVCVYLVFNHYFFMKTCTLKVKYF